MDIITFFAVFLLICYSIIIFLAIFYRNSLRPYILAIKDRRLRDFGNCLYFIRAFIPGIIVKGIEIFELLFLDTFGRPILIDNFILGIIELSTDIKDGVYAKYTSMILKNYTVYSLGLIEVFFMIASIGSIFDGIMSIGYYITSAIAWYVANFSSDFLLALPAETRLELATNYLYFQKIILNILSCYELLWNIRATLYILPDINIRKGWLRYIFDPVWQVQRIIQPFMPSIFRFPTDVPVTITVLDELQRLIASLDIAALLNVDWEDVMHNTSKWF